MSILLVKTSSLGDVIHNLPVVSDLAVRYPDDPIDWLVEAPFAEIVRLHPAVRRVIPVALRRWRRTLWSPLTWREMRDYSALLKQETYLVALDTQGLLKSALLTSRVSARRMGFDAASAREPWASRFYDQCFAVDRRLHAVSRNRLLAATALGYEVPKKLNYGIAAPAARRPNPCTESVVLLTATSRDDKLWPEARWIALGNELSQRGLRCLLPAGTAPERARAQRLAQAIASAQALPPMRLTELAALIAGSRLVIGVDTGLVHLAAALDKPTIALFCASDSAATGVLAGAQGLAINLGARGAPPSVEAVLSAVTRCI